MDHGREAQREMPGSRFELFPGAGHFPYRSDPRRFVDSLSEFIAETEPADLSTAEIRDLVLTRAER
jgi:hypothetical protein